MRHAGVALAAVLGLAAFGVRVAAQPVPPPDLPASPNAQAETFEQALDDLLSVPMPPSAPDLFGFAALHVGQSIYDDIWRSASSSAWPDDEPELNAFVARIAALPLSARVVQANAWINARVAYSPDPSLTSHHWGGLAQVLSEHRGEPEDIATAKLQLLAAAGVTRQDLYLVLVRDGWRRADDALLVVRGTDQVFILACEQDDLLDPDQIGRFVPVVAFNADGGWVFGKRDPPSGAPRSASAESAESEDEPADAGSAP